MLTSHDAGLQNKSRYFQTNFFSNMTTYVLNANGCEIQLKNNLIVTIKTANLIVVTKH